MTQPGSTQLTRMRSGPSSRASARVRPVIGRLGGDIGRAVAVADHPGDRAEIDDRAAAGIAHLRPHRLGGEELVAQVDRHAVVPIFDGVTSSSAWRSSLPALLTSTRIGPMRLAPPSRSPPAGAAMSRRSQGMNSGAGRPCARDALDQRLATAPRRYRRRRPGALRAEMLDQALADAAAAAGDEDAAVLQARDRSAPLSISPVMQRLNAIAAGRRRRACRRGSRDRSPGRPAARARHRASDSRRHRRAPAAVQALRRRVELGVVDLEVQPAAGDVELDHVAVLHQRQRAADRRLGATCSTTVP